MKVSFGEHSLNNINFFEIEDASFLYSIELFFFIIKVTLLWHYVQQIQLQNHNTQWEVRRVVAVTVVTIIMQ